MAIEWTIAIAFVALIVAIRAVTGAALGTRMGAQRAPQVRRIRIDGMFLPAEVHVRADRPARLIFRREETAAGSENVFFPDLGISVMLPPFKDVVVDLPVIEPGEHEFACQMQSLHGKLIVDETEHPR